MTKEQIHSSLDKMLENPKGKNFINHLVRAYMPITNVEKVFDKPEKRFRCVLTNDELFSFQDIFEVLHSDEFKEKFMSNLKNMFTENAETEHPMSKYIGDKKLGLTGKNTTTYMSHDSLQEFYNWFFTKAMKGDKHINWLLSSVVNKGLFNPFTNENTKTSKPTKKVEKQKASTYTLGDASGVLAQLKAKMENN